jgi:hypothetical protein
MTKLLCPSMWSRVVAIQLSIFGLLFVDRALKAAPQISLAPLLPSFSAPPTLQECHARNQRTRTAVTSWISRNDWLVPPSLYGFGLPEYVYPTINNNVGPLPIGHDLLSFFGSQLLAVTGNARRLQYFEVGVSVGKCLFTQLEFFGSTATIFAYDVEDINPTFARMLTPGTPHVLDSFSEERLKSGKKTIRRRPGTERTDTIKKFISPAGGELRYLAADEYNSEGWAHLKQQNVSFDLIYSDAFHEPPALLFEAEQLLSHELINLKSFAIVWDDCLADMVAEAVCPIIERMRRIPGLPRLYSELAEIHGWTGINDSPHQTCILSTLDIRRLREGDVDFAAVPMERLC